MSSAFKLSRLDCLGFRALGRALQNHYAIPHDSCFSTAFSYIPRASVLVQSCRLVSLSLFGCVSLLPSPTGIPDSLKTTTPAQDPMTSTRSTEMARFEKIDPLGDCRSEAGHDCKTGNLVTLAQSAPVSPSTRSEPPGVPQLRSPFHASTSRPPGSRDSDQ